MRAIQDLRERIKYADPVLKKKIILGSLSGVFFLVASVLIVRSIVGPGPERVDRQTQQALDDLTKELTSKEPETLEAVEADAKFQRGGQTAPNN